MFALLTYKFSEQRIASAARACMLPHLWKRLHMPCVYMLTEMRAEICLRAFWTNFFLCCWLWCCISQYKGLLALQISLFDTNNVETLEGIGQSCQDQENMPKIEAPFYFGESVQGGSVCLFSLYVTNVVDRVRCVGNFGFFCNGSTICSFISLKSFKRSSTWRNYLKLECSF